MADPAATGTDSPTDTRRRTDAVKPGSKRGRSTRAGRASGTTANRKRRSTTSNGGVRATLGRMMRSILRRES
jgi:hypothetical protein